MIELEVKDMACGHCAGVVRRAVKSVDPDAKVGVDLQSKRVRVEGNRTSADELIQSLGAAGYPAVRAHTEAPAAAKKGCCCSG